MIDYNKEWQLFKKSRMQDFNEDYLSNFDYFEGVHCRYDILPKCFDWDENDNIPSDKSFEMLNYGWNMWIGSLLRGDE